MGPRLSSCVQSIPTSHHNPFCCPGFKINPCALISCRKFIDLFILEESSYEKDVSFKVHIGEPRLAPGEFWPHGGKRYVPKEPRNPIRNPKVLRIPPTRNANQLRESSPASVHRRRHKFLSVLLRSSTCDTRDTNTSAPKLLAPYPHLPRPQLQPLLTLSLWPRILKTGGKAQKWTRTEKRNENFINWKFQFELNQIVTWFRMSFRILSPHGFFYTFWSLICVLYASRFHSLP